MKSPQRQNPAFLVSKTGRKLRPYPDKKITDRTATRVLREQDEWLIVETVSEARARGDDYVATMFSGELPISKYGLSIDIRTSANEYLFGRDDVIFDRSL